MPKYSGKRCSCCQQPGFFAERVSVYTKRRSLRGVCETCRDKQRRHRRRGRLASERNRDRSYMTRFRRSGYFERNPDKRWFSKPWSRRNIEKYLFLTMQRRHIYKSGRQYRLKLTFDEFLAEIGGKAPKRCPVLGIRLFISPRERSDHLPTIDRIDNKRPYEKGNIAIMSRRANVLKGAGSGDEHRKIAAWMAAQAQTRAAMIPLAA